MSTMTDFKRRQISGRGIPVTGNDIDTDRIIPARFLKAVTFEGMPRIADWAEQGRLDVSGLVTRRYSLADINRAYEDIETDAVGRGVIIF